MPKRIGAGGPFLARPLFPDGQITDVPRAPIFVTPPPKAAVFTGPVPNLLLTTLAVLTQAPFGASNSLTPTARIIPTRVQDFIAPNTLVLGIPPTPRPFVSRELQNPPARTLRQLTLDPPNLLTSTFTVRPPFIPATWPESPVSWRAQAQQVPNTLILGIPQPFPFVNTFANAPVSRAEQRFEFGNLLTSTLAAVAQAPFNSTDWPAVRYPIPQQAHQQHNTLVLGIPPPPAPFAQTYWPAPLRAAPAIPTIDPPDLLLSTLIPSIIAFPFNQFDWPNAPIPVQALDRHFTWTNSQIPNLIPPAIAPSPPPDVQQTPAGRHKPHRRLFVEIDGNTFEVASVQEAVYLLERAKRLALETAPVTAEKKLAVHLTIRPTQRPKIERPRIASSNPELQATVKEARAIIGKVYADAYRDAEIKLRLAKLGEDDDEDDVLMLI